MKYYPYKKYEVTPLNNNERFVAPLIPFLGGALIGGAAVGLTRPRPIYNVAPYNYQYGPYPYGPWQRPNYNPYFPY